jgi:hypothetical protein
MDEKEVSFQDNNPTLELYNEIIANAYDTTDILAKTELSGKEIQLIAYGKFMADRCKAPIIQEYINNILVGKLSLKRQSRKEANDLSKSLLQSTQQEAQPPTMMEHLFGTRKY